MDKSRVMKPEEYFKNLYSTNRFVKRTLEDLEMMKSQLG